MAIPRPSYQELVDKIYLRLTNETGLTANLNSSIVGAIVKVISAELDEIWSSVEDLEQRSNLSTAVGADLDNWGMLFGVMRRSSSTASTFGLSRALRLVNNGVSPAIIPAGTRVYKESDPNVAFFTTEGATIPAGAATEVHIAAVGEGEFFNVGIGELNRHSVPGVSVTVTNILPVQNGASQESDGSYRERILQEIIRRKVLNRSNVVSLMRSVPGVRDAILLDMARGSGTFDLIIIPYNVNGTAEILSECQAILNNAIPAGLSGQVRAPRYRNLDVQINITFLRNATNRDSIRQSIREQIASRIDNLEIEDGSGIGAFSVDQITAIARLSDPNVFSVDVRLGLDGNPLSNAGVLRLQVGERLALRTISVE